MNIKEIKNLKCGKCLENVDLIKYNTYKISSIAKLMVFPENEKQLIKLLKYLKNNDIKHLVLGNGSNVIFNSSGYDGVIIKLDEFNDLSINDTTIKVGAGYSLMRLANKVCKMGLTGLEFATGIPGSVGGAVYMNAGAYKSDLGYVISEVKVLTPDYKIKTLYNKDLDFHYRSSFLQDNKDYICLEATIILRRGNKQEIIDTIEERKQRRLISQPLEYPSAGSVFRNPEGEFAGHLIEEVGYKGKKVGDAEVSMKHANFIINTGHAKGEDIKQLIKEVQDKVKEKYNIELKIEQEFVE